MLYNPPCCGSATIFLAILAKRMSLLQSFGTHEAYVTQKLDLHFVQSQSGPAFSSITISHPDLLNESGSPLPSVSTSSIQLSKAKKGLDHLIVVLLEFALHGSLQQCSRVGYTTSLELVGGKKSVLRLLHELFRKKITWIGRLGRIDKQMHDPFVIRLLHVAKHGPRFVIRLRCDSGKYDYLSPSQIHVHLDDQALDRRFKEIERILLSRCSNGNRTWERLDGSVIASAPPTLPISTGASGGAGGSTPEAETLIEEISAYPVAELPGASGLWAVGAGQINTAFQRHWPRLTTLCDQLFQLPPSATRQLSDHTGKLAALMSSLSAFCREEDHGPEWNQKADAVMARFVPSLRPILHGRPLGEPILSLMSVTELLAAVRVARNSARRGIIPHLVALSNAHPILRLERVGKTQQELLLARRLLQVADQNVAACASDFVWMAQFDLYRALGEWRMCAPEDQIYSLSERMGELHARLTEPYSGVPERYRWRTLAFSLMFENAARSSPRPGDFLHDQLLEESASAASPVAREFQAIFELNAAVARRTSKIADSVERLISEPGVFMREKSSLSAPAAAIIPIILKGSQPGISAHLQRELALAAASSLHGHDLGTHNAFIIDP